MRPSGILKTVVVERGLHRAEGLRLGRFLPQLSANEDLIPLGWQLCRQWPYRLLITLIQNRIIRFYYQRRSILWYVVFFKLKNKASKIVTYSASAKQRLKEMSYDLKSCNGLKARRENEMKVQKVGLYISCKRLQASASYLRVLPNGTDYRLA